MPRRIYLVGAGTIARKHAEAADELSGDVELAAADPSPEAREAFGEAVPGARLFEHSDEMLAEESRESDVVVVAAPPFVHRYAAIQALESGRHVLCEKPLARDRGEAEEMVAAAEEADRLLGSCNCRYDAAPSTDVVIDRLADGAIGEPYRVRWIDRRPRARSGIEYQPASRWFVDASRSGGGVLMDWGPYDLHGLVRVLDPEALTVEDAWTARPTTEVDPDLADPDVTNDVEQHVGASLRAHREGGDVPVTYERAACTHGDPGSVFAVEGTEGALTWEWKEWEDVGVWHSSDESGERVTERLDCPPGPDLSSHDLPLVRFVEGVEGGSTTLSTGRDALFEFASLRAIYDCAETGEPRTVRRE